MKDSSDVEGKPVRTSSPRILIIPSWYPTTASPLNGIFVREQADCLARRFPVTVLTQRSPSAVEQFTLRWGKKFSLDEERGLSTLRVRRLRLPSLERLFLSRHDPDYILPYYRRFCRAMREGFVWYVNRFGRPDIIHAHVALPAGWVAVELGQENDIPVVLTEHSCPFSMHTDSSVKRDLVCRTLRGAARLVAVSPALRGEMNDVCPDVPIDVIGNIIDTDFFTPDHATRSTDGRLHFFALGFLTERKGMHHLLNAAHLLRAAGQRAFEIRIGGTGPERANLERLAHTLGIQDHCCFLGALTREAVRAEMQACDVYVLPSLEESFGIVVVEAMACGKPVLATRCGGPNTLITPDTGVLVSPGNPPELAHAMAEFLGQTKRYDPGVIRQSAVAQFSASAFLNKISAVYDEVLCRARPAMAG